MKFSVRFGLWDMLKFKNLVAERRRHIRQAQATPITADPVNALARSLHPPRLDLVIAAVAQETPSTRTYRLVPDPDAATTTLPYFRAGQYLSLKAAVGDIRITRAYTISSAPDEALNNGFYEITMRRGEGGFLTEYAWRHWQTGTKLVSSAPCGEFYYERLRDMPDILALAGGSGVTPFRSMIKDIIANNLPMRLTLLYGTRRPDDIIFGEELADLARQAPDRIAVHLVCSEPDEGWSGPAGFLTAECIRGFAGDLHGKTVFICGPPRMYALLEQELRTFNLPHKRIRREVMGAVEDIAACPGYPADAAGETFTLTVRLPGKSVRIPAQAAETVLVAMERAKLAPPSLCRSGACGYCRSRLMGGTVYVSPENDGRRSADPDYGYFHPCASYPVSDLEIEVSG